MPSDVHTRSSARHARGRENGSMNRSRSRRRTPSRSRTSQRESRAQDRPRSPRRHDEIDRGVPERHDRERHREEDRRRRSRSRDRRVRNDDIDRGVIDGRSALHKGSRHSRRTSRSRSPASVKRRRSRDSPERPRSKRSKRDSSLDRTHKASDAGPHHRRRHHSRSPSPRPVDRGVSSHRPREDRHDADRPRASGHRRSRSRSRRRDIDEAFPSRKSPRHSSSRRDRDRSGSHHPESRRRSPASAPSRDTYIPSPRSPRSRPRSRDRQKPDLFAHLGEGGSRGTSPRRHSRHVDSHTNSDAREPRPGAGSEDVNMSRGGFRGGGGYGEQMHQSYPPRGGYGPGSHQGSQRGFHSGQATPQHSYQGSPPAQSPYGGGRGGWNGQPQFSPQHAQQYSQQGGYIPQGGPPNQYSPESQAAPYGAPTGPSHSFGQAPPFRGNFRGSSRGSFGPGRGAPRGGFKNAQWVRNGYDPANGQGPPSDAGGASNDAGSPTGVADNPFRPSKDLQVEDSSKTGADADASAPAGQQPSKISFGFKAAAKPGVNAPKPEIASKFNPTVPSRPQPAEPPRDHRDHRDRRDDYYYGRDSRDHRDPRDFRDPRDYHEPRSGGRYERDYADRPKGGPPRSRDVPAAPRVRMVKKTKKRPKSRPELDEHLATSDSVFYRKPGNESVVGAGTYGKVFKGLHVYTKRSVALKRIRMEGERDGFPVTAVREIKLLQSLRHINIVALQEVMVEKNECFMVFEYMSHDLTGILNHPTFKLDAAQRKHMSKQLFEGLDYLHMRGVLHRDIKAANILVSSDGILKLADFGLARFYAKRHQLDYTNRVVTIWYRSPELLLGETQYTPAVDIWSASCVMVEIFTKHAIFPGDGTEINQLERIYNILGTPSRSTWPSLTEMPWFELLRPDVKKPSVFEDKYRERLPAAAYKLLAAMFQYDPAKRPTAAQALEHAYFVSEIPAPRQAVELAALDGDWHEFESRNLRKEKEKKAKEAKEARDAHRAAVAAADKAKTADEAANAKKRSDPPDSAAADGQPDRGAKRQHLAAADAAA